MANAQNGMFVWHDHLAKDPKAAIAFYTEVIGWKSQPFGDSHYTMIVGSQGPLGCIMELPAEAAKMMPPHLTGNVQVADVDGTCALVKKLGGKVYKDPSDIPTVGRFAVIADPQGASIAVFKPNSPMQAHDETKEGEVCWNELLTTDQAAAFKFYSEIFGWKTLQEMDMGEMGTYRLFGVGEKRIGGMMNAPKGAPTAWLYYFETSNLDAALDRAKKKGAKVLSGPMPVPTGSRIVQLLDTQGAVFALHELKK